MPLARRLLTDFVVGLAALGVLFSASLLPDPYPWIDLFGWIPVAAYLGLLVVGAVVAGYREPSLTSVWVHAPVLLALELPLAPIVLLTFPDSFEASGYRTLAMAVILLIVPLLALSFVGFFLRRWKRDRGVVGSHES